MPNPGSDHRQSTRKSPGGAKNLPHSGGEGNRHRCWWCPTIGVDRAEAKKGGLLTEFRVPEEELCNA